MCAVVDGPSKRRLACHCRRSVPERDLEGPHSVSLCIKARPRVLSRSALLDAS
jgi:hypothetical protein